MLWLVLVVLAAALAIGFGPRPRVVLHWLAEELPTDLERLPDWLSGREAQEENITEGAEKHIEFANPDRPAKTPYAVLYLHGFSATRQEIAPVPERVAKALGANYYGARLTGHGQDGDSLGRSTARQWLRDTAEAWQVACELGEQVIVISCSTGSTLATWLAEQPSTQHRLAALVLFSPNYQPKHWASHLFGWPWSRHWLKYLAGEHYGWEAAGELNKRYWTNHYPTRVLHELQALVIAVRNSPVDKIRAPSLFIYSDDDQVVNARYTDGVYRRWGADVTERIRVNDVDDSNHVITGDIVAPQNTETSVRQILEFLERQGIGQRTRKLTEEARDPATP
ncbi:alpha/beta hydrolase [Saccharospirillum salsuginis]|uniref:Lysophospholipase n=1 Tax=Saccharospirillum salsuginis TaxID=418750 RepID=A0A918KG23_9GAMM|nr:alpha/beta fold hydrolase [Saccharospirillum salsuginis]GGX59495.1 lysophospholipase [Saccharospirillum salsuginis]